MATYKELAEKYSAQYGVPLELVLSVMSQESQGKTNAVSPKGASGLMQLMPETAKGLGVTDIFDVEQNVEAGVKYLGQQLQEFGTTELALAAYNAGPGAVRKYNGIPPFAETQKYVSNIIGNRLPQAKQAVQGKAYDLSGGKGVLDINAEVGGASSKAASPTASGTDALSVSRQSLQQVQRLLAGGLPQADYEAASASSLNALRGNLNNTRAALDVGQRRLEEQAAMGNQQTQMLLDRYNQDPALATSRSSENAQALSDLQAGLLNTIKAKRGVANATLFSDPGTFMSSLLMGNPYARGQKDIEAEISALRNSNQAMTGTINDQRGLLTAATATPASTIMAGMEAQLRLAGLEKDVGLAEADAPVKISEAKTNALLAQVGAVREVASSATSLANAERAAAQSQEEANPLRLQAQEKQWEATIRTLDRQEQMQAAADAAVNPEEQAAYQAEADKLGTLAVLQQRRVEAAGGLPQAVGAANVSNAQAGAVQAASAAKLAPLNAQTAEQLAAANSINAGTSVKQAGADAANFDAKQSLDAQALSIQTMQQQMKTMDTSARLAASPELVSLQKQYERDKAVYDAGEAKANLARQDAANRVASKQLTAAEGGLDQTAKASNKVQQAYLAAGGTGQLIEAQLSEGVKANLAKVAEGQPAGANPVEATEVLNAAGLLKSNVKYPELETTATKSQSLTQDFLVSNKREVTAKSIKEVDGGQVADFAKLNNYARQNVDDLNIRGNSSSNPYAMPDHRKMLAWATANNKLTDDVPAMRIATLPEEVAFDKIGSVDGMFNALRDSGQSVGDASTALASYFTLAIEYNNSNNGYDLLGLRPADKDDFTVKGKSGKRLDLTTPAGIMSAQYSIASGFNVFR